MPYGITLTPSIVAQGEEKHMFGIKYELAYIVCMILLLLGFLYSVYIIL
jgi:hypothetical protein